jgi:hypothetical protein
MEDEDLWDAVPTTMGAMKFAGEGQTFSQSLSVTEAEAFLTESGGGSAFLETGLPFLSGGN